MANCPYGKAILKISQTKGSGTKIMGAFPSPSSSFPPFFKGSGAGGAGHPPDLYNLSLIYVLTNNKVSATNTGGYLIGHGYG